MNWMFLVSGVGVLAALINTVQALWNNNLNLALAWGTATIWALVAFIGDLQK